MATAASVARWPRPDTLKALAFIHLRKDDQDGARHILETLKWLDPTGQVGWPVIAALADGLS